MAPDRDESVTWIAESAMNNAANTTYDPETSNAANTTYDPETLNARNAGLTTMYRSGGQFVLSDGELRPLASYPVTMSVQSSPSMFRFQNGQTFKKYQEPVPEKPKDKDPLGMNTIRTIEVD